MFLTRGGGRRAEDAPAGPHGLAREVVAASQRGRLIEAIAHVVADKGYPQTTVADVIERAGVSRKTFYEHFHGKEACFLAAYDTGVAVLLDTVRAVEGIRGRVRAYLDLLDAEPAFARTFLIEVRAAGPKALQRRRESMTPSPPSSAGTSRWPPSGRRRSSPRAGWRTGAPPSCSPSRTTWCASTR